MWILNATGTNTFKVFQIWRYLITEQQHRTGTSIVVLRVNPLRNPFSTSRSVSQESLATTKQRVHLRTVHRRIRFSSSVISCVLCWHLHKTYGKEIAIVSRTYLVRSDDAKGGKCNVVSNANKVLSCDLSSEKRKPNFSTG